MQKPGGHGRCTQRSEGGGEDDVSFAGERSLYLPDLRIISVCRYRPVKLISPKRAGRGSQREAIDNFIHFIRALRTERRPVAAVVGGERYQRALSSGGHFGDHG